MTTDLVVARYKENWEWVLPYRDSVVLRVYSKSPCASWMEELPNVGRESHTFLHHICTRWDRLSDWTVFLQGDPFPHLPKGSETLQYLLTPPEEGEADFKTASLMRVTEGHFDEYGQLKHTGAFARQFMDGSMRRASTPFIAWMKRYAPNADLSHGCLFVPGAQFGISKERLQRVPLATYEELLAQVSDHVNPEEGHYVERLWFYLFTSQLTGFRESQLVASVSSSTTGRRRI